MKHLILITIAIISLTGCFTDPIELELNNDNNKKLVIDAWLNETDDNQSIQLSYTSSYFDDTTPESIEDALVTLKYNNETLNIAHSSGGEYKLPSDWKPLFDTEYTLVISHEGTDYTANNILRKMPDVFNVYAGEAEDNESDTLFYEVFFSFTDTDGEGDGYFGFDYKKDELNDIDITEGAFIDDEYIDGVKFIDISLSNQLYQEGDEVVLELHSIGKDASRFLQDIEAETFRDGLFDPAPVNVRSNFDNGAVGYFILSGKKLFNVKI